MCVCQGECQDFGFTPTKFIKYPCGNSENTVGWPSESEDLGWRLSWRHKFRRHLKPKGVSMKTRPKDRLQCLEFAAMRRNQPRERERTANTWGGTPGAWQACQKHVLRRELTVCLREQSTMRTDTGVNKAKVTGDPDPSYLPWSAKGEKSDWNRFWEDVERCSVVGEVRHLLRRFFIKSSGDLGWRLDAASSEMRNSYQVCVLLLIWYRTKTWSWGGERRISGILLLWKSLNKRWDESTSEG